MANIKNGLIVNGPGTFNNRVSGATATLSDQFIVLGQLGGSGVGTQGFQGLQGNQGIVGDNGTTGTNGNQGNQGNIGNLGSQGNQGNIGTSGGAGNTGVMGPQGNIGISGLQGNQGANGNNGSSGFLGFQGPTTKTLDDTLSAGNVSYTDIYINHIIGSNSTISSLTASSLGTNVTSAIATGADTSIKIVITTSGASSGSIATFTFMKAYPKAPIAVVSCSDYNTANAVAFIGINATNATTVTLYGSLINSNTYRFNVLVVGI